MRKDPNFAFCQYFARTLQRLFHSISFKLGLLLIRLGILFRSTLETLSPVFFETLGTALAEATGKCDLSYVSKLLSDPDKCWDGGLITPAVARGLYLARVDYKPGALVLATEVMEKMLELEKVVYNPNHGQVQQMCDDRDTTTRDCDDTDRGQAT